MNDLLSILKAADFNWAVHLRSVWEDSPYDVPEIQAKLRSEIRDRLEQLGKDQHSHSHLGWVLVGSGGVGKTHFLSYVRREAVRQGAAFVLVDMTDVCHFWETVLLGLRSSLEQTVEGGAQQHQRLLELFFAELGPKPVVPLIMEELRGATPRRFQELAGMVLRGMMRRYHSETLQYQDAIRAIMALNSDDFGIASAGMTWMQGFEPSRDERELTGFSTCRKSASEIVQSISWLMSLVGPIVLAFDQLDPIVAEVKVSHQPQAEGSRDSRRQAARAIIENISSGLGALRDVTYRTFPIISCLESTWSHLVSKVVLDTNLDRFEPPRILPLLNDSDAARQIVQKRMQVAAEMAGVELPHPTWPVADQAFGSLQGISPRAILKRCHSHLDHCVARGEIEVLTSFASDPRADSRLDNIEESLAAIDEKLDSIRLAVPAEQMLAEQIDEEILASLLRSACDALTRENPLPSQIDVATDFDFPGKPDNKPLHARIRLIFREEGDREEHWSFRSLQRVHASAFQARLRAAITQAGICEEFTFRRLVILRTTPLPSGPHTRHLIDHLSVCHGQIIAPEESELRTLAAVAQLISSGEPLLDVWLKSRRPVSQLEFFRPLVARMTAVGGAECQPNATEPEPTPPTEPPVFSASPPASGSAESTRGTAVETLPPPDKAGSRSAAGRGKQEPPAARSTPLTLGYDSGQSPVTMAIEQLVKHTAILAGAGSGKTVLLKRMIEESALLGIPAIVLDAANDLSSLGERRSVDAEGWLPGDPQRADRYHEQTEVVIWTPGRDSGNSLRLSPLPDFSAVADDEDELELLLQMTDEFLLPIVAPGSSKTSQFKQGILRRAMRVAKTSSLPGLIHLLDDLPASARLNVKDETKLAGEMADRLRVELETNPLLRGTGTIMDPAVLFGDDGSRSRTRVSVINLMGLPSLEAQRQFVNQLAMALFVWLKKNPTPPGRPLRGLFAIDEAKDYVPSGKSSACKASLLRLTAQGRKYHLGMMFATQQPREIDHSLIGNCSTHYYGKANSPAAIQTIKELVQQRRGDARDIGTLAAGKFYVYNADANLSAPVKVSTPMCLSHHRKNPLDEREILEFAVATNPYAATEITAVPEASLV